MATHFEDKELKPLIEGCLRKDHDCQQKLYKRMYGFAMSKCLRYSGNKYDAAEILNDGFMKAFKNLHKYDHKWPFHSWLGKIMSNTAIDRYRSELKHTHTQELIIAEDIGQDATIYQRLNYQDLLVMIQQLPPSYRTVFNLFAIDGHTHEEISDLLGISIGTSKSNLFKARQKLQKALAEISANESSTRTDEGRIIPLKSFSAVNISMNGGLEL